MAEKKELECCVVRDLLPTYVEGLTEPETFSLQENFCVIQ